MKLVQMDAYLEEELYDILTYTIQNPNASDFELKKKRIEEIGRELYADGGTDAMENMFNSIEFRIKDEIGKDAKPYRLWWNNISPYWKDWLTTTPVSTRLFLIEVIAHQRGRV